MCVPEFDCILTAIRFISIMLIFYKLNIWLFILAGQPAISSPVFSDSMELEILQYVNDDRKVHGLSPLEMNDMESSLAAKHSQDMARGKVPFGHSGFNTRAKTIQKVIGSNEVGENVASGPMTAREVVDGWLHSPGHKKNIEGDFRLTGIGYAMDKKGNIFFTQIFSR
jgi:uncharacterized protein YkwD